MSGTGQSNVGSGGVYGKDDQRNYTDEELRKENDSERFNEGKSEKGSHNQDDPKDERSIANRLAAASKKDKEPEPKTDEQKLAELDPTAPALSHGNKPSKGAIIDKEIADEEAEILAKKGSFGPNAGN